MYANAEGQVVVVGAGLAGWTVLKELRKRQPDRQLVLVTADAGDVYSKPMLSNALQLGRDPAALVQVDGAREAERLGVRLLAHTHLLGIDRAAKTLQLRGPDGEAQLPYGQLVLALGAQPIRLPLQGDAAAVHTVNHLDDYARWHQTLHNTVPAGSAVAVLGAGLIGVEFANDLLRLGLVPHVFDLAPQPLGRLLPAEPAAHLRDRLAAAGVVWHLADPVEAVERRDGGLRLTTRSGQQLQVAAVLSAVGLQPHTALAAAAGLAVARGIVVDAQLRTSDPNIYAVGDCAAYPGLAGPQPLPFVLPLMQAARTLAATLASAEAELQLGVMPVVVKTPACPVVVAPPPPGVAGEWHSEALVDPADGALLGVRAQFVDAQGALRGFALTGDAATERQQWQRRVAP